MLLEEKKGYIWKIYSTDHGDFDGNMSRSKQSKLSDQFGASCRIISQPINQVQNIPLFTGHTAF